MNVVLPEKNRIKKRQLFIYISIIIICIISVIIAFYVQFYTRIDIAKFIGISQKDGLGSKTEEQQQTIKSEFNTIFNNTITNDNDTNNSKKEEADKKIVYTKYEKKETKLNSYDLEVHIPHINISGEVVEKYNQEIENIFVDMAKKVLQSENNNVIYTVEYVANIQDDILSVMIKSNLKEGSKAQKVIIQTYSPENFCVQCSKEQNYEKFYKTEIELRKQLKYPPFCDIIMFGINSSSKEEIKVASEKLYKLLKTYGQDKMQIMPPLPAPIDRIKYRYRWRIIAKCKLSNTIIEVINKSLEEYYKEKYLKTRVIVDVNPNNMS